MSLSVRRLIDDRTAEFCLNYVAALGEDAGYCYAKAFAEEPGPESDRSAKKLLEDRHVQAYLAELREPPGDSARRRYAEEVKLGASQPAMRAAESILDDEEKLSAQSDMEYYLGLLGKAGAEIIVTLPGSCRQCGAPYESATPLARLLAPEMASKLAKVGRPVGQQKPGMGAQPPRTPLPSDLRGLPTLPTRQREILRMRFGLDETPVQTIEQAAKLLGVSIATVLKDQEAALATLYRVAGEVVPAKRKVYHGFRR